MRIVIVGPGAIGCLLAGFLARTEDDLWLLDKDKERAKILNNKGITVKGLSGDWQVKPKVTSEAKEINYADLIIICVKSYDTKDAVLAVKSLVKKDTYLITLQNGLGNIEVILEVLDQANIAGGITNQGATLLDIGLVKHTGKGETIIGDVENKISAGLRIIREIFNKAGWQVRLCRDIKAVLWSKLIINVGINALSAITRLKNGDLVKFEGAHKILTQAVTEAVRVAKRKRIKLIYDDPLAKVEAVCEATANNISSMLQDILKKKRTEIDAINGVIVRQAQELGIPVPINSLLVDLVRTIEQTYNLQI